MAWTPGPQIKYSPSFAGAVKFNRRLNFLYLMGLVKNPGDKKFNHLHFLRIPSLAPPLSLSERGIGARLGDPPRHLERWRVVVVVVASPPVYRGGGNYNYNYTDKIN